MPQNGTFLRDFLPRTPAVTLLTTTGSDRRIFSSDWTGFSSLGLCSAMSTKSPPTSPSAARRFTSPTPASPTAARAGSVKPSTPEKPRAGTPARGSSPVAAKSPPAKAPEPATPDKKADKEDEADETVPPALTGPDIDKMVFDQITEMDDEDPECEFSREIVVDYFKQAATTFEELRQALTKRDLGVLSAKGHFLKGSSAALGIKKVQDSCEHIQHYGAKRDEINNKDLTEAQALRRITLLMPRLEKDFESAKKWLENYYLERGIDLNEGED